MPANVLIYKETSQGDLSRPTSAWHRLGQRIPVGSLPSEVGPQIVPFKIEKKPVYYKNETGIFMPYDNRFALVREPIDADPKERPFGIVAGNYQVIPGPELFAKLDPLAREWPLETAGALGFGETVFMLLKVGDTQVGTDPLSEFLLVVDRTDGSSGLGIYYVNVRTVCQNTLQIGINSAVLSAMVRHDGNLRDNFDSTLELMAELGNVRTKTLEIMQRMSLRRLAADEIDRFLSQAMPLKAKSSILRLAEDRGASVAGNETLKNAQRSWELNNERVLKQRSQVLTEFAKLNDERGMEPFNGTLYNMVQAVAAYADHTKDARMRNLAMSAATGDRAELKTKSFQIATRMLVN